MTAMRPSAIFCVAMLFCAPLVASAQGTNPPPTLPEKCPRGASTGDPSGTKVFLNDGKSTADVIRDFIHRKTSCPNACYDIRITISQTKGMGPDGTEVPGLSYKTEVIKNWCTDKTKAPKDQPTPMGCAKGQKQPEVTVMTPALGGSGITVLEPRKVGPKSRCRGDAADTTSSIVTNFGSKCTGTGDYLSGNCTKAATEAYATMDAYNALPRLAPPVGGGPVAGSDAIVQAFTNAGIDETKARDIVEKNPDAAADYLKALESGDKAAQAEALKKLTLNADLSDPQKQALLKAPSEPSTPDTTRPPDTPADTTQVGQNTFEKSKSETDFEKARCAISKIESGSCDGRYNLVGPWTPKGYAYGRYQVMDFNIPNWTRGACGRAYSPGEFLADSGCQDAVFNTYFGQHVASCGSYEGAAAKWFSGKCYITNASDGYTSVGRYVQKFASVFGSEQLPFGGAAAPYSPGSSPFAQVNPFYSYSSYNSPYGNTGGYTQNDVVCDGSGCYLRNWNGSASSPYGQSSPYGGYSGNTGTTGGFSGTGGGTTGTPYSGGTTGGGTVGGGVPIVGGGPIATTTIAPPVGIITIQPKNAKPGDTVLVSWASAGVRASPPCQVTIASSTAPLPFAEGNGGSRRARLNSATTYTFALACTPLTGGTIERSATILVQ